jgi:hypothetical protein
MHIEKLSNNRRRRRWLLEKALECVPFSEAVALARRAELFLIAADEIGPNTEAYAPAGGIYSAADPTTPINSYNGEPLPAVDLESLTVLAAADDIIRYLREHDLTILPDEDGTFLVNGQFRETFKELTDRGNRLRQERGLPCFTVISCIASAQVTADRKPSAQTHGMVQKTRARATQRLGGRQRDEWARRVIDLDQ